MEIKYTTILHFTPNLLKGAIVLSLIVMSNTVKSKDVDRLWNCRLVSVRSS